MPMEWPRDCDKQPGETNKEDKDVAKPKDEDKDAAVDERAG
jgi:hypothetical protein